MDEEDELQKLINEHGSCATERLKVACESKLWEIAKTSKGLTAKRSYWLETTLGYKEGYRHRETLKDAPPAFWDYVEANKLKLSEAVEMWYDVLGRQKVRKIHIDYCLQKVIDIRNDETEQARAKAETKAKALNKIPSITVIQDGWEELQQAINKCLIPVLAAMSPKQQISHIPRFNRSIRLAIASLYTVLKREANAAYADPVSVTDMNDACSILQMTAPEFKQLADLAEAKNNKRILVQVVHPDQSQAPDLE